MSSITNFVQELSHELTNNLRLGILGNLEILEKCQLWVEMQPIGQPSFQKLEIDNSCQKHAKLDITFLKSCPILLYFFSLCQIFWLGL